MIFQGTRLYPRDALTLNLIPQELDSPDANGSDSGSEAFDYLTHKNFRFKTQRAQQLLKKE